MKFAKTLDDEAIPEWKTNYFDYKQAKRKLKAVGKAVRNVPSSPPTNRDSKVSGSSLTDAPVSALLKRRQTFGGGTTDNAPPVQTSKSDSSDQPLRSHLATGADFTPAIASNESRNTVRNNRPATTANERTALRSEQQRDALRDLPHEAPKLRSYGSIIGSPPGSDEDDNSQLSLKESPTSLRLPNPAVPLHDEIEDEPSSPSVGGLHRIPPRAIMWQQERPTSAYEVNSPPRLLASRPLAERLFSFTSFTGQIGAKSRGDLPLDDIAIEAYRELDAKKAEFIAFLNLELAKINAFYKAKEEDAVKQLSILREQLHIMRERRLAETEHLKRYGRSSAAAAGETTGGHDHRFRLPFMHHREHEPESPSRPRSRLSSSVGFAQETLDRVRTGHVGKTSTAMAQLGTPTGIWNPRPDQRDYGTRQPDVSHHTAKRKMKIAIAEYYRYLELIKSYATVNRTAFRKIVKKYDKTARSRQKSKFMDEHVNPSYFVKSEKLEMLIVDSESLYSRYFERGNHKIAVSKLRARSAKASDYTGSVGRTCFLLGVGTFMALYGLVNGAEILTSPDSPRRQTASFLMQLYAGYFFMLLLTGLFVLDAAVFDHYKVNYPLIFELEPKSRLDWRQLAEVPALFFFLFGGAMWLNFSIDAGGDVMFQWWFVVLLALSACWFFFPARLFYYKTRIWFLRSLGRLALSGFYTIEFRDFFLGDMFCSLTYSLGNIELFFCLYARQFTYDTAQCTSSRSRLLGFFTALPGIWRAIQCVRRYANTGAAFPHMFNFGKYCCTILQYVSLSVYRIDRTPGTLVFFIVAATINSIYCIVWDINYDWSLGNFKQKKYRGLRGQLSYRKQAWLYYLAMVVDPILRFNWIFYVIFRADLQHASLVSFLVALSEVFRRGLWTLFRVENEHCTNIMGQKATRSLNLPYDTESLHKAPADGAVDPTASSSTSLDASAVDAESGRTTAIESPVVRTLHRVGTTLRTGHQQDYVKKAKIDDDLPADSDSDESDE